MQIAHQADVARRSDSLSASALGWATFEGGRDAYVIMISALMFMPYVVTTVIGDPVAGQAIAASYAKVGGFAVALTAPLLGGAVDRFGPRKPWLAACIVLATPLIALLWFAQPGPAGLPIATVMTITVLLAILMSYSDVLHNSMMPHAARPGEQARASGLALSLGNAVAFVMVIFMLWGFFLPGRIASPLLPSAPLFGLDAATFEPNRIIAPIVALVFAIGSIPILLWSHDAPRTKVSIVAAFGQAASGIYDMVRHMRMPRDAGLFLLGRMFYSDAKMAILMFGGIYAAGIMGWGSTQLLMMGITATLAGVFGGFLAARMDSRLGPRRALMLQIVVAIVCLIFQVGLGRDTILYMRVGEEPLWDSPVFATLPELLFLANVAVSSVFSVAAFSSSRTMMTAVAPREQIGTFFGLYALSGTATIWLGPLLIEIATRAFDSQRAGIVPLGLLLGGGLLILSRVRGGGAPGAAA